MSDLSFARPLCERLAKAMPDLFTFRVLSRHTWTLQRTHVEKTRVIHSDWDDPYFWAFFGPLADERTINGDTITGCEKAPSGRYTSGILESLMVAVVESYDAEGN